MTLFQSTDFCILHIYSRGHLPFEGCSLFGKVKQTNRTKQNKTKQKQQQQKYIKTKYN